MALQLLPGPFTVDTYHRLAQLGILHEDDRVELLDGQIVEMTPIGPAHAACVYRLGNLLARLTGGDTGVSVQNPVILTDRREPQPDVAVVRRPQGTAGAWLPSARDVLLVSEVADTSLEQDRDVKLPRYAAAGIPEAWLVDLQADTIAVYRDASEDGYRDLTLLGRGDTLTALALPDCRLSVSDILG